MHICVVPLQGQFLLWLQSHLFLTFRSCGRFNSISSSRFGLQLFDLHLGSTSYPQPYVFFKIEYFFQELCSTLSHLINSFTNRGHIFRNFFWVPTTLFYLQKWTFYPLMQLQIHICVVPFQGQLHLWLQSHLCITIDHVWGVNSGSGSSSRSIFGL